MAAPDSQPPRVCGAGSARLGKRVFTCAYVFWSPEVAPHAVFAAISRQLTATAWNRC
jgi:hypothetical protein